MKRKLLLLTVMFINIAIVHAQWSLTGNSIGSTDFLGSVNTQPLIFKVNNLSSGLIDYDNIKANTAFGFQALITNTGSKNSSFGYNALFANTRGQGNTATGHSSLTSNTTGNYNTAAGYLSLNFNTTGNNNAAFGSWAAYNNTTGRSNIAIGIRSLYSNAIGNNLIAIGDSALFSHNTKVNDNIAIGSKSMFSNTFGSGNIAVGRQALYSNTSGSSNVAVGWRTLYLNTTGENNAAFGLSTLSNNTEGYWNAAYGSGALFSNTTGYDNVAVGVDALQSNTTGYNNTSAGVLALTSNVWGYSLTALGYFADVNYNYYWNTTVIGANAIGTAWNQVRIGDYNVGSIGGYVNWTNISDGRVKENIKANVPGLAFINKLTPVTYNLNLEAVDKIIQAPERKDKDGNVIRRTPEEIASKKLKEEMLFSGFIAQDVEKAATSAGYDFSGVDKPKNDKDLYGLRYAEFVVPLVKAVQELSSTNDSLKQLVTDLQSQINEIKQQIRNLKADDIPAISSDAAFLKQNAPNPFYSNTTISYYIPLNANHAQLVITDISGRSVKNIAVNNKGFGQVTISAGTLATGSYIYTLIIDGKRSDSKQMILTK